MPNIVAGISINAPPALPAPSPSIATGNPRKKITVPIIRVIFLRFGSKPFSTRLSIRYAVQTSKRDIEDVTAAINTKK